mmetsp:Transcript_4335/g.6657  ORF Transcript_4335/g.6657 Transcript_4335/m.6657 type:complete len:87 (+) Transcript_4335:148-408(+)
MPRQQSGNREQALHNNNVECFHVRERAIPVVWSVASQPGGCLSSAPKIAEQCKTGVQRMLCSGTIGTRAGTAECGRAGPILHLTAI